MSEIHPLAIIHEGAQLGTGVTVGAFTIIGEDVHLADGTSIGSHTAIGMDGPVGSVEIGPGSVIRSHSVIYRGVEIGSGLSTGHRVTIREGSQIGNDVKIGTLSDIQGNCTIGNHTRLHSNVHVGQLSQIGNFVWIFPYVVLTNDPHPPSDGMHVGAILEDYCSIATMSVVFPGVTIGRGALVGASSLVTKDVRPDAVVAGIPAADRGDASKILLTDGSGPAYPWRRHFHRGYPDEVVAEWREEFDL